MGNKKKSFFEWLKNNKTKVKIFVLSVPTIAALFLWFRNRGSINEVLQQLNDIRSCTNQSMPKASMKEVANPIHEQFHTTPWDVSEHIRNLPEGRKASTEKIATADTHGHTLMPGQTWVKAYRKGIAS